MDADPDSDLRVHTDQGVTTNRCVYDDRIGLEATPIVRHHKRRSLPSRQTDFLLPYDEKLDQRASPSAPLRAFLFAQTLW